jgi:hypothetical protein
VETWLVVPAAAAEIEKEGAREPDKEDDEDEEREVSCIHA